MAAAADRAEQPNIGLIAAASVPDSDPCDIACEALPARVAGDLGRQDQEWLLEHADDCNYCANELRCYDVLGEALEAVGKLTDDPRQLQPPPLNLPRRDRVWYVRSDSPLGELILAATPEGLREIEFGWRTSDREFTERLRHHGIDAVRLPRMDDASPDVRPILERAARELAEYFGGRRSRFDVPLDWGAMPPFQRQVLEATAAVPFGHLETYGGIAKRIGKPGATRAVGNALGRNPIPVIVPCHRVIRSDATIGGYTGGLEVKERLLSLEGVTLT